MTVISASHFLSAFEKVLDPEPFVHLFRRNEEFGFKNYVRKVRFPSAGGTLETLSLSDCQYTVYYICASYSNHYVF